MASVSFTFNLDPVASTATRSSTTSAATESSAAIGAKYDSVQTNVQGASHLSGLNSPACVSGDCFLVHGDGPGVTTLSVGEEDGGMGDYITLPVVDGSLFLEPPIGGVAADATYDVTTLAIGEEDGGIAAAPPEIGGSEAIISSGSIGAGSIDQTGAGQLAAAPLGAIQTTPIVQSAPIASPVPKPTSLGASAGPVHTASSPLPPIQTVPITEPRAKPTELAGASFPLPELKPEGVFASTGTSGSAIAGAESGAGANSISVGDYDAYIASLGGNTSGTAVAGNASASSSQAAASAIYVPPPLAPLEGFDLSPISSNTASVIYSPPPLPPIEPFNLPPVGADEVTVSYRPPPLAPIEAFDFTSTTGTQSAEAVYSAPPPAPIFGSIGPVETAPLAVTSNPTPAIGALETSAAPRIKPASFTTEGSTTLAPIQTVPIQIETSLPAQAPLGQTSTTFSSGAVFDISPGSSAFVVDGPIPSGKPDGVEAPRLSDDDFRISTLALGEEEAGGG